MELDKKRGSVGYRRHIRRIKSAARRSETVSVSEFHREMERAQRRLVYIQDALDANGTELADVRSRAELGVELVWLEFGLRQIERDEVSRRINALVESSPLQVQEYLEAYPDGERLTRLQLVKFRVFDPLTNQMRVRWF